MDIRFLKGVGEKRARLFNKLGLFHVEELLAFYPRTYEDRTKTVPIRELRPGESACFRATVASPVRRARIRQGMELYKTKVFDETGELSLTFFNAPYVKNALICGETYVFYGKPGQNRELINPVFEVPPPGPAGPDQDPGGTVRSQGITGRILPVYRTTAGLTQGALRSSIRQALENCDPPETLPDGLRGQYFLCTARFALENIHFPQNLEMLNVARKRLVFEELLLLQLGLAARRGRMKKTPGPPFEAVDMGPFYKALPFVPTDAQREAIGDIQKDVATGCNRLIQGDVGCGKTVVAAAAAYLAFRNGYQTALMAPTGILAEQHARSLQTLFAPIGMRVGLVTGRDKKALDGIANGEIDLAVGTHALLSESVSFARLGLAITDEQHRFGVEQRQKLFEKGKPSDCGNRETQSPPLHPHRLVMSATPIPRTLARILYGDLDVTVMRGLPPGRTPVGTYVVDEGFRARVEGFVRKTVEAGGQVYIVCPVIGESEELDLQAADVYAEKIKADVYPDLRVGLLHGKIKPKERESVMRAFADGELQLLVATTVIEVGVDVPNATLMVVENAERFGLSQLHQLRGRVGRGGKASHCVLFMQNESARERLEVLRKEHDGYAVAEADLRLRGPGDFFGNRQHGLPEFKIADLSNDMDVLRASREAADALGKADPSLSLPGHAALKDAVEMLLRRIEGGD
ncbi:MAG: ATP-dependent DNA helicase RecG [Oscillospiraceae bacterium]|jgi:ATP-dependent DNA helicase RecG|nr:ATP-dependent DNA helicase RecG [Oscillospiraceae bacterium]